MEKFNRNLLAIKLFYLFFFGGFCCIIPYITPFGIVLGFNYMDLGIIWGILPFVGMIAKPLIGKLADTFNVHRVVLIACVLLSALLHLAMWWLPADPKVPATSFGIMCTQAGILLKMSDSGDGEAQLGMCHGSAMRPANCVLEFDDIGRLCAQLNTDNATCVASSKFNTTFRHHFAGDSKTYVMDIPESVTSLTRNITVCIGDGLLFEGSCHASACGHEHRKEVKASLTFFLFFILLCSAKACSNAATSISDAVTFDLLSRFKRDGAGNLRTNTYGFQRSFGTIGWFVVALVMGFSLQWYSNRPFENAWHFAPAFIGQTVLYACAAIAAAALLCSPQTPLSSKPSLPAVHDSKPAREMLRVIFYDAEVLMFCLATAVFGMASAVLYAFLSTFILEELHAPKYIVGIAMAVETVAEYPVVALSHGIIRRAGPHGAMTLSLAALFVGYLSFSLLTRSTLWWIILLPEILHGFAFGLFYCNMVVFADSVAPSGTSATVQGIFGGIYEGFGIGIGGLAAGYLLEWYGFATTWRLFGCLCGIVGLVYYVLTILVRNRKSQRQRNIAKDDNIISGDVDDTTHLAAKLVDNNASNTLHAVVDLTDEPTTSTRLTPFPSSDAEINLVLMKPALKNR